MSIDSFEVKGNVPNVSAEHLTETKENNCNIFFKYMPLSTLQSCVTYRQNISSMNVLCQYFTFVLKAFGHGGSIIWTTSVFFMFTMTVWDCLPGLADIGNGSDHEVWYMYHILFTMYDF